MIGRIPSGRLRQYVVRCSYADKAPFYFGTIAVSSDDQVVRESERAWARMSPHPKPQILEARPGMLVLVEESAEAEAARS